MIKQRLRSIFSGPMVKLNFDVLLNPEELCVFAIHRLTIRPKCVNTSIKGVGLCVCVCVCVCVCERIYMCNIVYVCAVCCAPFDHNKITIYQISTEVSLAF